MHVTDCSRLSSRHISTHASPSRDGCLKNIPYLLVADEQEWKIMVWVG